MSDIKILIHDPDFAAQTDEEKIKQLKEAALAAPAGSTVHIAWIEQEVIKE